MAGMRSLVQFLGISVIYSPTVLNSSFDSKGKIVIYAQRGIDFSCDIQYNILCPYICTTSNETEWKFPLRTVSQINIHFTLSIYSEDYSVM